MLKLGQAESSNVGFDEKLSEGVIVKISLGTTLRLALGDKDLSVIWSLGGGVMGIGVGRGVEIFTWPIFPVSPNHVTTATKTTKTTKATAMTKSNTF